MIYKCIEFGNKEFKTQEHMFAALKKEQDKIIELKRAQIYKSNEKGQYSFLNLDVKKASGSIKGFDIEEGYIYPVISTTRYLDSHKDVHFDGCFNQTAKDQQGKVYYANDHELRWNSVISWPKDIEMFVSSIDWQLVGKSYPGQTEGLVFKIAKSKVREDVLKEIEAMSADFENSIRMTYEKIRFGVNSNSDDFKEEKSYFDSRINEIANKDVAYDGGYYWGVEKLRIYKEGSLVIAGGSNDATSIITLDPSGDSQEIQSANDPSVDSQKSLELIRNFKFLN